MSKIHRPLGIVMQMAAETGIEITYAYEDLAFSDYMVYIIRFDKNSSNKLHLYFNNECDKAKADLIKNKMVYIAAKFDMSIAHSGSFSFTENTENEVVDIAFIEKN